MPTTYYTPTQHRVNDPYQQRIFQFNHQDSRVYLSRTSNFLLKSFGNDAIIKGFDIVSSTFNGDIFEVVVDSGILIQDCTLIEVTEQSTLSIDISGFNACTGSIIIYSDYQYIETTDINNQFLLKIAYVTDNGLLFQTDTETITWNPSKNRIYFTTFRFTKGTPNTSVEKTFPEYMYLNGSFYEKRGGLLNFYRSTDPCPSAEPFFYNLMHEYSSTNAAKLITQLHADDGWMYPLTNLQLLTTNIKVSIDEYKPFTEPYKLLVSKPEDADSFTISSSAIPLTGGSVGLYTLTHNYNQRYFLVEVYDDQGNLFRPHYINFTSDNTLTISFRNVISDLAPSYKVILINSPILVYDLVINGSTPELVDIQHTFSRLNVMIQLADPTNNLYDNTNNSIFNVSINNEFTVNTNVCDFIDGTYKVIVYRNTRNVYFLQSNNTYIREYHLVTRRISSEFLVDNTRIIEHTFKDYFPAAASFDQDMYVNFVDEEETVIESIDDRSVEFSFPTPALLETGVEPLGKAYIYSYDCNSTYMLSSLPVTTAGGINTYTLELPGWNTVPVFQVYDSTSKIIHPLEIREITAGTEYEFDFSSVLSSAGVDILVTEGWLNYTSTFTPLPNLAPVLVTHNLNSKYLLIQIFDSDTHQLVFPENIKILNNNSINIYLSGSSVASSYKINILTGLISTFFGISYNNGYHYQFSDEQVVNRTVTIVHNLNFMYPMVQVYDSENYQNNSATIQSVDQNTLNLIFPVDYEVDPDYKAILTVLRTTTTL